ncbi:MAG: hypothetical protein ACO3JL_19365, partial [Myxococcota bacterium]
MGFFAVVVAVTTSVLASSTNNPALPAGALTSPDEVPPAVESRVEAEPGARTKVLLPEFRSPDSSLGEGDLEMMTGVTALYLGKVRGLAVLSMSEMEDLLTLEESKALAGCDGSSSCLSEVANALDVQLVVRGAATRVGPRLSVQLSLLDVKGVESLARVSVESRSVQDLSMELKRGVHELTAAFGGIPGYTDSPRHRTPLAEKVSQWATHPDVPALVATLGIGLGSICVPVIPCMPLVQGLLLGLYGDDIAGRDYPRWWCGSLAGGLTLITGAVTAALLQSQANQIEREAARANVGLVNASVVSFAAGSVAFFTLFVLQPVAVWLGATWGARDTRTVFEEAPAAEVT